MSDNNSAAASPVRLAERRVFSDSFKPLYNDGMKLVETAAGYLDGEGGRRPNACRGLPQRFTLPNPCASQRG